MNSSTVASLAILLALVNIGSARDASRINYLPVQQVEEREIMTREKLDAYLAEKDDLTSPIMDLAKSSLGGIGTLSQINYTQEVGQVAWEVANAVVPIIGAALALIPGVGVIVSGVFLGMWSLISPLFAPKKDNPIEKMIQNLVKTLRKETDDKLSNLVDRAIYGEIVRNNYICSKYTYVSQDYAADLRVGKSLQPLDALKLIVYLDNCDNFLKDTAEAFVYDEYADVLWVPAAVTTAIRLGFLTELFKYGQLLGMKKNVTVMYFQELKKDIKRQFEFFNKGMRLIRKQADSGPHDKKKDYLKDVSKVEKASCKLQGQFYYFDRELYAYGSPKVLNDTDMFADIKMADHYKDTDGSVKHLQIFFNVNESTFKKNLPEKGDHRILKIMNCFLGPFLLTSPSTYWFKFQPIPKKRFSYEFRVIYLQMDRYSHYEEAVPVLTEYNKRTTKFIDYLEVHKTLYNNENPRREGTSLNIEFVFPSDSKASQSKKLIHIPGWARWKTCPFVQNEDDFSWCNNKLFTGGFRMYSAGSINLAEDDKVSPILAIDPPTQKYKTNAQGVDYQPQLSGFLLGVEIILRPYI